MSQTASAQIIEDAADLLLIHGRTIAEGVDRAGRLCVLGAVSQAKGLDPREWMFQAKTAEVQAISNAVRARMPSGLDGHPHIAIVWRWNDCTVDDFDVIDTLRHIAKDIRNEAPA